MLYLPNLDIWGNIFDNLSPADLIHFGQINKTARIAVTNYSQLKFDIKRVLLPYFSEEDIKSFRQLQLITGTVISGSTALQFFDRTTYPESDLDIYAEHRYCRDVAWWLMSKGYEYQSSRRHQPKSFIEAFKSAWVTLSEHADGYLGHGVNDVFNFYKPGSERKVQLISATVCPMDIILNFHSTCVMNFITHSAAYSLYPYATFQERRSLICGTGAKQEEAHEKYRQRGWRMVNRVGLHDIARRSDLSVGRRWVGDGRCWTMPLRSPHQGIIQDRITSNSWTTRHFPEKSRMLSVNLKSSGLRFRYVFADDEVYEVFRSIMDIVGDDEDELNEQLLIRFKNE